MPLLRLFHSPLAPKMEGAEKRTVIMVAIVFQIVFTGYRAIQNLQSSLNDEGGRGVISLSCLYAAWIVSGMLTPAAIRLFTAKGTLMLAWVAHALYTAASFYPAWELLVPSSVLLGALSAPMWTSQALYITACGYSFAKTAVNSPYDVFSSFNGIFFTIYETSQIIGNLVSSLVIRNGVGNKSEEILFKFCGPQDCPADDNATNIEEPEGWVIDILLAIYISCNLLGLVLTFIFITPLPRSDWSLKKSTKETVTSFFVTLKNLDILLLIPIFLFQGMQQALLYSEYTRAFVSCPIGIHMVGFVMAAHGATTPLVTWVFSRLVRLTGRYLLFLSAGSINLSVMLVMYFWTPDKHDAAAIFFLPIMWGVAEGIWFTQTSSVIAVHFAEEKEPAFAIYHTFRSVGLALTFSYSVFLCTSIKMLVGVTTVCVALILYTVAELRLRWRTTHAQSKPVQKLAATTAATAAAFCNGVLGVEREKKEVPLRTLARSVSSFSRQVSEVSMSSVFSATDPVQPSSPTAVMFGSDGRQSSPFRVSTIASSTSSLMSSMAMMGRTRSSDGETTSTTSASTHGSRRHSSADDEMYF